jgi:hypothetical protein
MKAYEISPILENIKETFKKDTIDRNMDVVRFCTILDSIESCFSIALDGKWGSGKTFFVKQTKLILDLYNDNVSHSFAEVEANQIKQIASNLVPEKDKDFEFQPQVAVYYDAWANDNDEDPILSLIYTIIQSSDTDFRVGNKRDYIKIAGSIADFFTGKRVSSFLEAIKGEDPLASIKKEKPIHELMTDFINSLLFEHGNRLVVIIDELDRCKPSYAVQLLERIKHYFDDERVTFVFSINTEQLQHTIKRYYGNEFAASRYLDRFFDLRISLPQPNLQKYYQTIAFEETSYTFDQMCELVIKTYHFGLREIAKYVHLVKVAAHKPTHDDRYTFSFAGGKALFYALQYVVPVMIGLKIYDESSYNEFVLGKNYAPLINIYKISPPNLFYTDSLLNSRESYDSNNLEKEKVLVSPEDKIKEVYDALFVEDYSGGNIREKYIGSLQFNEDTKKTILRTVSLLSNFSDYTI